MEEGVRLGLSLGQRIWEQTTTITLTCCHFVLLDSGWIPVWEVGDANSRYESKQQQSASPGVILFYLTLADYQCGRWVMPTADMRASNNNQPHPVSCHAHLRSHKDTLILWIVCCKADASWLMVDILCTLLILFNCERSSSTIYQINLSVCLFVCLFVCLCHSWNSSFKRFKSAIQSTDWD